ncbi:hypothetical protein B0J13DRAFT_598940 [Dactylonectria estremocensis]|uniref:Amidohydrolase-related domain-containing protein n=1 Tax=Dactylonectria estremocensis TaxID=1079267 RepID=A0A9P9DQI9_9HYPO|nr:hypothetical protein B0J13DRAFT_598940 [Dactylonectria estremocensis]
MPYTYAPLKNSGVSRAWTTSEPISGHDAFLQASKSGVALIIDEYDHVKPTNADIIIEGNKIVRIDAFISVADDIEVIDCTNKIQTQFRGRHANDTLIDYLPKALEAGTTTVMDHAHMNFTVDHSTLALAPTVSSGIRSIFGYCPSPTVESWKPFQMTSNMLGGHVMATFDERPASTVRRRWGSSLPEIAHSCSLLDSSILWSHATGCTDSDIELFKKTGSTVSSTASSELQMAHGRPIAYQDRAAVIRTQIGLGIDCHSSAQGSIPAEMRLGLQDARPFRNERFLGKGLAPLGMGDQIGSIQVGKLADLVILDAMSPAMVCSAQHDPVAAVVLHSGPADVECDIIDGKVGKKGGKLLPVKVEEPAKSEVGKETWE